MVGHANPELCDAQGVGKIGGDDAGGQGAGAAGAFPWGERCGLLSHVARGGVLRRAADSDSDLNVHSH